MKQGSITVLAGAGASKAVNSKQYPTTVEFFERLPESIKSNSLFEKILEFINSTGKDDVVDIELVLWQLYELKQFCTTVTNESQLVGWMLKGNRWPTAINSNQSIGQTIALSQTTLSKIEKLINEINEQVYKLYGELPTQKQLESNWIPLLSLLFESSSKLEIVTTNYDLVLETALNFLGHEANQKIDIGWRGPIHRTLDRDLWLSNSENGLLTKLHGSVNWTLDDKEIYISDPTFKGSHDKHAIIYPGFKGREFGGIFSSFHQYFGNALAASNTVIFIGFAFRDEYINELCERFISKQSRIITINPEKSKKLPFQHPKSKVQHITSGLNQDSVKMVASVL